MRNTHLASSFAFFLILTLFQPSLQPALGQSDAAALAVLDRNGGPISFLTDGDAISLRLALPGATDQARQVAFQLSGTGAIVAECTIPPGKTACETRPFASLGWYWGPDRTPSSSRFVTASSGGVLLASSPLLEVAPRPVVMVHGFSATWEAWANYLGPEGYLAGAGIPAYAVGDGQAPGALNTGRLDQPTGRTNPIAENAAILEEYIQGVLKATRAQKVDLVAHSMGGIISRYYIDRLMEDEVGQLIMLGSPMAGTECANLPASLNFYLPAALEIQPSYVTGVFNPQITHRNGVPFYALARVPIRDAIQSPCTSVPTDLAVSLESVTAIPLQLSQTPVLHTELNLSEQVFRDYVLPLLQTPPGGFALQDPGSAPAGASSKPAQFSRIETGHIDPGETRGSPSPLLPCTTPAARWISLCAGQAAMSSRLIPRRTG